MESMEIDKKSNGSKRSRKENNHLRAVSMEESGEGFPYAPENWPNPGDTWSWKVGRRVVSAGYFQDRYLYVPKHLRSKNPDGTRKKYRFASKLSVEKYIREAFPGADIDSFFSSFTWKIQAKQSLINGKDRNLLPPPSEEIAEPSMNESECDGVGCKAGNKMCGSLLVVKKSQSAAMPCDICCSEPGFCRDCCCILCSHSISSCKGRYNYIKCEALVSEGGTCGHIAHVKCALQTYMAGTVGGSIGLDAEYYCRRCDARTDLIPYCVGLLETCKSVDSQDELEKILNVGIHILNGSEKTDARGLLNRFEMAIIKLKCGTIMEDIWKPVEDASPITSVPPPSGNATLSAGGVAQEVADCQDVLSNRTRVQGVVSPSLDCQAENLKLEDEIDQVLQEPQKSQEYENKIAEERLYAQKEFLQNPYQQLQKERSDYMHRKADSSADDLWTAVLHRVDQINEEDAVRVGLDSETRSADPISVNLAGNESVRMSFPASDPSIFVSPAEFQTVAVPSGSVPLVSPDLVELFFVPKPSSLPEYPDGEVPVPSCDLTAVLAALGPDGEVTHRLDLRTFGLQGLPSLGLSEPSPVDREVASWTPLGARAARIRSSMLSSFCHFQYLLDYCMEEAAKEREARLTLANDSKIQQQRAPEKLELCKGDLQGKNAAVERLQTELSEAKEVFRKREMDFLEENARLRRSLADKHKEIKGFPSRFEECQEKTMLAVVDGFTDCYGEDMLDEDRLIPYLRRRLKDIDGDTSPAAPSAMAELSVDASRAASGGVE